MKVIDLLNKIAKGEEVPEKIKYNTKIYNWDEDAYLHYEDEYTPEEAFLEGIRTDMVLNDEVEIIEEKPKKIEECKSYEDFEGIDDYIEHLRDKINKLIKAVNYLLEKESDK